MADAAAVASKTTAVVALMSVGLYACGGGVASNATDGSAGGGRATALNASAAASKQTPAVKLIARVSQTPVDGNVSDYVYRVQVTNGSDAMTGAVARLVGAGPGTTVIDGIVRVGDLAPAGKANPEDTVTLRHDSSFRLDRAELAWTVTPYAPPGAATCAALVDAVRNLDLFPPKVNVSSATLEPATSTLPEHCNLRGTMNERQGADSSPGVAQSYAIKWQVRLPTVWNGRFQMPGGGGLNGSIPNTTTRLAAGYASAANDSGHDSAVNTDPLAAGAGAFGTDFEARTDFAYRAIELTTRLAKGMITSYYDRMPDYSYFEGCSMGGREALMVTQRLPKEFDGVVSGDPALRFPGVTAKSVYISQIFGKLAQSMGVYSKNGVPLASNTYTNQDLQLISKAVLGACDALDGLVDGIVDKPLECSTARVAPQLEAVKCAGAKTASCLSGAQIDTIKQFYEGAVTPTGQRPYHGWTWDPGIAGCTSAADCNTPTATNIATGWRSWNLGNYAANPATAENSANAYTAARGGAAATVVVPTPPVMPSPTANEQLTSMLMNYDLDAYVASMHGTSAAFPVSGFDQLDTSVTDLTPFRARGGKLVIYQPQTGGPFSPLAMIDYYRKVNADAGGTNVDFAKTQSFARLFMMPGAQHCGGGPSTSNIDAFGAVVDWVEKGTAPERIVGTAPSNTPWPGRTRPLCPFPTTSTYVGSGDINNAANFVCR